MENERLEGAIVPTTEATAELILGQTAELIEKSFAQNTIRNRRQALQKFREWLQGLTEKVSGTLPADRNNCISGTGWRVACRYSSCWKVERSRYASTLHPRPIRRTERNRTVQRREIAIVRKNSFPESSISPSNNAPVVEPEYAQTTPALTQ